MFLDYSKYLHLQPEMSRGHLGVGWFVQALEKRERGTLLTLCILKRQNRVKVDDVMHPQPLNTSIKGPDPNTPFLKCGCGVFFFFWLEYVGRVPSVD